MLFEFKFVADGIFKAELNEFLKRELAEDGYSGVEVRVTPVRTEIIILATRTQNVLGEKGRRIRELTSVVQKRFNFQDGTVEVFSFVVYIYSWLANTLNLCKWMFHVQRPKSPLKSYRCDHTRWLLWPLLPEVPESWQILSWHRGWNPCWRYLAWSLSETKDHIILLLFGIIFCVAFILIPPWPHICDRSEDSFKLCKTLWLTQNTQNPAIKGWVI